MKNDITPLDVLVRGSDGQKFLSLRDLIVHKQVQIIYYQHLLHADKDNSVHYQSVIDLLQHDLDEYNRIQNED